MIVARLSGLVRGLRRSDSHGNGVLYGEGALSGCLRAAVGIDLGGELGIDPLFG